MIELKNIQIKGFVKKARRLHLYDDMKLSDLLFMAGGLQDPKHLSQSHLKRADIIRLSDDLITKEIIQINLKDVLEDSVGTNIKLKNNDVLIVYGTNIFKSKDYVAIDGIVKKHWEI